MGEIALRRIDGTVEPLNKVIIRVLISNNPMSLPKFKLVRFVE
jgi:hypothetical protein